MTKKMRGFTKDGWVRVQRTVLRRVVGDRLQALLRGDFYVRNHLGEEDYDPILREVAALPVPPPPPPQSALPNGHHNGASSHSHSRSNGGGRGGPQVPQPQSPDPPHKVSPELETFIQLIAASIMIDASMRGENAGESDTRFIKKKKKLLAKTLQGPKLGDFRREVLRFDMIRRGEEFEEEEIVESEESRSSESESESESEDEPEFETKKDAKKAKKPPQKQPPPSPPPPPPVPIPAHVPPHQDSGGEGSSSSSDDRDSTVSDTGTSGTSLSQDGLSASAASSSRKGKKKEKKRMKKERKRERKRLRKERKKREKEARRERRKREREEKERVRKAAKRRKKSHHEEAAPSLADDELSDAADGGDAAEPSEPAERHPKPKVTEEEAPVYEIATREDFERYKADLLGRVPREVKSRFREGGFSRWGKDWLPVLELGPFDVEPGPVRDMWLEMFDNTQDSGRNMTRLVFWYGVKFEDRGQAYSFVPENKIINYEEGERKGFCKIPKKIQKKIEKKQRLTKMEEQIKRGLKEIEGDMQREKPDRAAWMMQFKEDYEYVEEEVAAEAAEPKLKPALAGEVEDSEQPQEVSIPKKRKPGRPKKDEGANAAMDKPIKRKPGRPKKVVVDAPPPPEEDGVVKVKKKGPGRPKKSEKEKAEKAAAKAAKAAARAAEKAAAKEAEKALAALAKAKKSKKSTGKWLLLDEEPESEIETEEDENDRDYDFDVDSGDEGDMDVDADDGDSDARKSKKRKADDSSDKKPKTKSKTDMTEEEKALEKRAKAAEYREKKARERAEAQGLEYVKGRVGRKSKQTMLEEEQQKFTKCEEVFLPMMDRLTEAKNASNAKGALKLINSITSRVELLTPPFLREYPLGMLMKTVRKSFEGVHPEVKEKSKRLTAEMKRVYTEKEKKVPDDFEPVKNMKSTPKHEPQEDDQEESASPTSDLEKAEPAEEVIVKSEKIAVKPEKVVTKPEEITVKAEKVEIPVEQSVPKRNTSELSFVPKRNASEMNLSEAVPRKMAAASSSECLPDAIKPEPPAPAPKQKKTFSLKGMFEKPKPPPKPRIVAPTSNMVMSGQPSPKPKSLPAWVTGPAVKMDGFHEQHAKERTFGLEFLVDAASSVPSSAAKRFDPVSVSQSFKLAIFAETKLRGRDWLKYWEKAHDVVAMLSPGKNKRNAILQGIICGDYQEPPELVKLSRREIQSPNQLKS